MMNVVLLIFRLHANLVVEVCLTKLTVFLLVFETNEKIRYLLYKLVDNSEELCLANVNRAVAVVRCERRLPALKAPNDHCGLLQRKVRRQRRGARGRGASTTASTRPTTPNWPSALTRRRAPPPPPDDSKAPCVRNPGRSDSWQNF